jgi:hypothetical protein
VAKAAETSIPASFTGRQAGDQRAAVPGRADLFHVVEGDVVRDGRVTPYVVGGDRRNEPE